MSLPTLDEIITHVVQVTSEQLGMRLEAIRPEMRIIEDLNCDSLELVELMMELESAFDITLPETSSDPVYKAVFTRSPFRISDFAELIFVRLSATAGSAAEHAAGHDRARWLADEDACAAATVPFSQLVGATASDTTGFDALGLNAAGFAEYRRRIDGMRCVRLPESTCDIGCDDREADEAPAHTAELSSFLIDCETVSVAAYVRFLNSVGATDHATLRDWFVLGDSDRRNDHLPIRRSGNTWEARSGTERWPMILVSWYGANAYSLWANGLQPRAYRDVHFVGSGIATLPSEAQWEYAARGATYREYPWGNDSPTGALARFGCHRRERHYALNDLPLSAVNAELGCSPFGLRHMAGNTWQWCADWYDPRFHHSTEATERNPLNTTSTGVRAERGGSWIGTDALLRSSYRRGRNPGARGRCLGFRCCSAPPTLA